MPYRRSSVLSSASSALRNSETGPRTIPIKKAARNVAAAAVRHSRGTDDIYDKPICMDDVPEDSFFVNRSSDASLLKEKQSVVHQVKRNS